jgi:hypothetical protein
MKMLLFQVIGYLVFLPSHEMGFESEGNPYRKKGERLLGFPPSSLFVAVSVNAS